VLYAAAIRELRKYVKKVNMLSSKGEESHDLSYSCSSNTQDRHQ